MMAHCNIFPYVFGALRGDDMQGHRLQTGSTVKEEGRTLKKKETQQKKRKIKSI